MARKPTLSPSRITTYLACPVKYRWTYVDARGRWFLRSKATYSFGLSLHRALERFYDSDDTGVQTVHEAVAALEEDWISAGYSSSQEMQEALGEGKAILAATLERSLARPATAKTLLVEQTLRLDMGPFVLVGRLDRLDEHPDGTLEIVDYKSGREQVSQEEVATDIAMACYQLLVRREYPDRNVRATIVALRTGAQASAALDAQALAEFEADLVRLGGEIVTREFHEIEPTAKPLCLGCDFLPLCKKHPEFALPEVDA